MSAFPNTMRRRDFLGFAWMLPAGLAGIAQDTTVAPLWQPDLAGRPRDRITDYENDPFIIGVEKRLRCTCGCNLDIYTCRTTDFTCTYSPQLHREVVQLVEEGKSGEEILAAFVAEHGETVLMAPPKRGFNWAGYLFPGIVITLVGTVLGWALVRRSRQPAVAAAPVAGADGTAFPGLSAEDGARLQAELDQVES